MCRRQMSPWKEATPRRDGSGVKWGYPCQPFLPQNQGPSEGTQNCARLQDDARRQHAPRLLFLCYTRSERLSLAAAICPFRQTGPADKMTLAYGTQALRSFWGCQDPYLSEDSWGPQRGIDRFPQQGRTISVISLRPFLSSLCYFAFVPLPADAWAIGRPDSSTVFSFLTAAVLSPAGL